MIFIEPRESHRFRLKADGIIYGVSKSLLAADIALSGLHADVSEQKLNLIEFPACLMTQPGTGSTEIVRCDVCEAALRAGILDDSPDHFRAESSRCNPPALIDRAKNGSRHDLGGCSPSVHRLLDPRRDGYGSNVASSADKVCEHPMILSLLEVPNRNRRQFRPTQSTPE
jgi:hypothetical protein